MTYWEFLVSYAGMGSLFFRSLTDNMYQSWRKSDPRDYDDSSYARRDSPHAFERCVSAFICTFGWPTLLVVWVSQDVHRFLEKRWDRTMAPVEASGLTDWSDSDLPFAPEPVKAEPSLHRAHTNGCPCPACWEHQMDEINTRIKGFEDSSTLIIDEIDVQIRTFGSI